MKDYSECLGFDDRLFRVIGIPVLALIIPPIFFSQEAFTPQSFLHSLIHTTIVWEGNRGIFILINKRFPRFEDLKKRLKYILLFCIVYTGISCTLIGILFTVFLPDLSSEMVHNPSPIAAYGASYVMLLAVGAVYESIRFFTLWSKTLKEKEHLERAHISSQLEGLRNQVNPHFLFNSLNTLIYLIPDSPQKAVGFVQQLSKVYRYVLESRDDKLIPLQRELDFLQSYIFLQKERFGDNLVIEFGDLGDEDESAIVPLTLQMLFENAIKHNIISAEKPLRITVSMEHHKLIVRNRLQRKNQVMDSTGFGLQNIKDRYRMLTGEEVEVIVSHDYFTVLLPIIPLHQFVKN